MICYVRHVKQIVRDLEKDPSDICKYGGQMEGATLIV